MSEFLDDDGSEQPKTAPEDDSDFQDEAEEDDYPDEEDEDKPAPSARPDRPRQQRPFHTEIIDGEEVVIFDDAQTT